MPPRVLRGPYKYRSQQINFSNFHSSPSVFNRKYFYVDVCDVQESTRIFSQISGSLKDFFLFAHRKMFVNMISTIFEGYWDLG
jgi:hypothetical protein